jgi:TolB-like protein
MVFLTACTTVQVGRTVKVDANAKWAVLPFVNYTETPQAGLRAESIAESVMRASSDLNMQRYPSNLATETLFESMDRKQLDLALNWARQEKRQYALTGSVEEWRYKVGVDGEPAVGITLQVIEVSSGKVMWTATGGSTGWSRESLPGVAQKLMVKLLEPVKKSVGPAQKSTR